jgi:membrane protease YdiL (CAAX protease family)
MGALRRRVRDHPLRVYVVLAYALTWGCWLPLVVDGSLVTQGSGWPTDLPGLAGPALAAAVTSWLVGGRAAVADLLARCLRWRVPAWCWLFVAGTAVLGWLTAMATSGRDLGDGWSAYTGAPDLGVAATFLLVLVVNGIGEEAGWRGFLAHHLLTRHDLIRTSALVTVVWAGWHLPLFLVADSFHGMGIAAIGWFFGLGAGSLVLTWLYVGSRRSVLLVALWHTVFNFTTGTPRMSGVPAAVVSTAVIVLAVVLVVVEKRSRRPAYAGHHALT